MIVVTFFLSIFNQIELRLVQNRKENCHHDHISFNVEGIGNIVFSVHKLAGLASLGIMGAQLRAYLKPSNAIVCTVFQGFQEALNWSPMMPKMRQTLRHKNRKTVRNKVLSVRSGWATALLLCYALLISSQTNKPSII